MPLALPSSRSTRRSSTKASVAACGATNGSSPSPMCAAEPPMLFSRCARANWVPGALPVSSTSLAANGGGCSSGIGSEKDSAGTGSSRATGELSIVASSYVSAASSASTWIDGGACEAGRGERVRGSLVRRRAVPHGQPRFGRLLVGDGQRPQLLGHGLRDLRGWGERLRRSFVRGRLSGNLCRERLSAVAANAQPRLVVRLAAAAHLAERSGLRLELDGQLLLAQRRPAALALIGGVLVLLAARRTGNHGCASIRAGRRMGQSAGNKGRILRWHSASSRVSGCLLAFLSRGTLCSCADDPAQ